MECITDSKGKNIDSVGFYCSAAQGLDRHVAFSSAEIPNTHFNFNSDELFVRVSLLDDSSQPLEPATLHACFSISAIISCWLARLASFECTIP